jgi:DNA-binding NtrC family response regulator
MPWLFARTVSSLRKAKPISICDDRPTLDELSRRYISLVLAENDGNKTRAAEVLGINRRTLYRYLDPAEANSDDLAEKEDS